MPPIQLIFLECLKPMTLTPTLKSLWGVGATGRAAQVIIGIFIPYLFLALLNRQLVRRGIEVKDPNSQEICTREVDLCLLGDYMFLCAMLGHQGSSSSFPCLRDYTPSSHLRKAHLDGSPHTPDNPSCRFERRTLESFDLDYSQNLLDKRNGGDMRKNGKYHGSVCS